MATFAQAMSTVKAVVDFLDELEKHYASAGTNQDGLFTTLQGTIQTDYRFTDEILASVFSHLNGTAARLTPEAVQSILAPALRQVMVVIDQADLGFARNMEELKRYMVANTQDINSRGISYGTITADGGNVGNGNVYELSTGPDSELLEGPFMEDLELRCVKDQGATDEHEEEFSYRGDVVARNWGKIGGSGLRKVIKSISARTSGQMLRNPSFETLSGTQPAASTPATPASTTSVTGWTLSGASDFRVDLDTVYRGSPGVTTPYSLKFVANNTSVSQILQDNLRPRISDKVPYLLIAALYRDSSADGTFTMRMGAANRAYTVSTLNNGAWNRIVLTLNQNLWYQNWKEADADIRFEWASRTTGNLYLDDVLLVPGTLVDGLYYWIAGGATAWLYNDLFTWFRGESTRGVMQYWMVHRTRLSDQLGYGFSLPSDTGGTETITDP